MSELATRARGAVSSERVKRYLTVAAAAAIVVALWLVWIASSGSERRAVQHLPEAERRDLYGQTQQIITSTCDLATRPSGLEAYCREQAQFMRKFPECDHACMSLTERYVGGPTR